MGIEPTDYARYAQPDGFEDRGHHQVYKHFRLEPRYSARGPGRLLHSPPWSYYNRAEGLGSAWTQCRLMVFSPGTCAGGIDVDRGKVILPRHKCRG